MSVVTDVWIIVGDVGGRDPAEGRVEKISQIVANFVSTVGGWPVLNEPYPTISLMREDWGSLQGGNKVAGSAAIWFGWNYADVPALEQHLKSLGIKHVTIWSHHENKHDSPPRVVSL